MAQMAGWTYEGLIEASCKRPWTATRRHLPARQPYDLKPPDGGGRLCTISEIAGIDRRDHARMKSRLAQPPGTLVEGPFTGRRRSYE